MWSKARCRRKAASGSLSSGTGPHWYCLRTSAGASALARTFFTGEGSAALALVAVCAFVGSALAAKPAKNQMVKGTIKSVNVKDGVLIVSQKLKAGENVDRQLDIKDVTEFSIQIGNETKELNGKEGLAL